MAKSKSTYVALLRGINVGGKNKLPMKALAAAMEAAGMEAVRTYIQSGNVLFQTTGTDTAAGSALRAVIHKEFGLDVPVVVRTAKELAKAIQDNPFVAQGVEPEQLHVGFLEGAAVKGGPEKLDANRSPPDRFALVGRELFLALPNGMARTKLTNDYFDRTLGTVTTFRNWRTVNTLLEMAANT